jgi:glutamyl-tRNA synthetase
MEKVRVRIAPSPTGEDLHIGNVYTALINYVFAKKNNGQFIIRIEDTDQNRLINGAEDKILSSLKWFGLSYDEGPDKKGDFGPYRQSERLNIYKSYAEQLVENGKAYYCFCDRSRLEKMRDRQIKLHQPTLYDGLCKSIDIGIAKNKAKNEKYVIRLNMPDNGVTEFTDLIRGKISFENKLIDDQILLKSDGFPTYHLAVVIDDHLMKISHIIRAEEWISSTPKHIVLYNYFGWNLPIFAHGPLLRNPDKSKLSKRKNPVWVTWYKKEGYLPEAILNYLALMGWSMPDEREIFSIDEMIDNFEISDLKKVGPAFDIKKLEWLNGEYIRKSDNSTLKDQISFFIGEKYPKEFVEKTIPLIKERIKKFADYLPLCNFYFKRPQNYEINLDKNQKLIATIKDTLDQLEIWKSERIGGLLVDLAKKEGIKNSEFFMILRIAITGSKVSPPLNESLELLGKKEVIERLENLL